MIFRNWIHAIRPKTLLASLSPCLIGLSLAELELTSLNYTIATVTIICAVLLQISSNLINDYFDAKKGVDTIDRLGPIRVTQTKVISEQNIKFGFIVTTILAFIFGVHLMIHGGPVIIMIGISSILFTFLYTAGPFPLSYFAMGEFFAFLFFGPIAVWGTYYLQTNIFSLSPLFLGFGVGLLSAAIMSINNIRDIKTDSAAGKKTISTIFGINLHKKLYFVFIFMSFVFAVIDSYLFQRYTYGVIVILLLNSKLFKQIYQSPPSKEYNLYLSKTAKIMFFYAATASLLIQINL